MAKGSSNPRYGKQFAKRARLRKRVAAEGRPCAICGKPIDYSLDWWEDPADGKRKRHPMSYELDEIVPVSRYMEGGYESPTQAATDYENVQPVHRICNQRRGARMMHELNEKTAGKTHPRVISKINPTSRAW